MRRFVDVLLLASLGCAARGPLDVEPRAYDGGAAAPSRRPGRFWLDCPRHPSIVGPALHLVVFDREGSDCLGAAGGFEASVTFFDCAGACEASYPFEPPTRLDSRGAGSAASSVYPRTRATDFRVWLDGYVEEERALGSVHLDYAGDWVAATFDAAFCPARAWSSCP